MDPAILLCRYKACSVSVANSRQKKLHKSELSPGELNAAPSRAHELAEP
jgi:hypothetical protein